MGPEVPFRIPLDWFAATVGSVCAAPRGTVQTGPFGSQLHASDYVDDGIPAVMPQDLGDDGRINERNVARVTLQDRDRLNRYSLVDGDLVYSRRGDLRRRAVVQPRQDGWLCGTGCLMLRTDGSVEPRFLFYALGHPAVQEWIDRHAVGATMPNLNTAIMSACPIPLPSLSEQRAIAAVLGALDDKFDSNRRMVASHADVRGLLYRRRYAGEDGNRVPLREIAQMHKGTVQPAQTPDVVFEQFSIPAFDAGGDPQVCAGATMASGKTPLPHAPVVLVSKLNPRTPRVWTPAPSGVGTPVCSPEFVVLRPVGDIPHSWLEAVVRFDRRFYDELMSGVTGSTGSRQRVKPSDILAATIPAADRPALEEWDRFAAPLLARDATLDRERRTLVSLRDALLPKLVSGHIRVPPSNDVEEMVGGAIVEHELETAA